MSENYKGVIFDFNGTLFFDNDKHILAWGKISKILRGRGITEEELLEHFNGVPNHKIVTYLLEREDTKEELEQFSKLKEEFYRKFCLEDHKSFHLVEGAVDFFEYLKEKKIPFTIASASIKENIDFFVKEFELERWMSPDDIIYDGGTYENKVAMFLDAAKKIKIDIKECMIVEDSFSGICSAYKAGCRNIIVVDSSNKAEEYKTLPRVTKVIQNFRDL